MPPKPKSVFLLGLFLLSHVSLISSQSSDAQEKNSDQISSSSDSLIASDSDLNLVAGVGIGTFITLVALAISIIVCLFARCSPRPAYFLCFPL